jgi:hypothetical protein
MTRAHLARIFGRHVFDRLRAEEGVALALAVSTVSVLAIGVSSGMLFTATNAGAAKRSGVDQTAYAAAEAGVNNAFAVLSLPTNNAFDPYLLPERTSTYSGGTVRWWGTLNQATSTWKVYSVATMQNPTGPSTAPVTRRLTADVGVSPALSQPLNNMGWNYIWATGTGSPSGCDMTIQQSVNVMSPLYVEGNLCVQNTATIGAGPLVVKGKLNLEQKANGVGTSSSPVNEVHLGNGCEWWNKGWSRPCRGTQDNVNARVLDTVPPPLAPPVPAWSNWYLNASPGPYYPCYEQSGTPPVFDNDQGAFTATDASRRNGSVATPFDLTPSTSYHCKTASGELTWDATHRLLTLKGTVYIDGSASVQNGELNQYDGVGSLYLTGTLLVKNSQLCASTAGTNCDTQHWDPNSELIVIVADGDGDGVPVGDSSQVPSGDSIQLVSSTFQGALFGTHDIDIDTTSQNLGPVIADDVKLGQSTNTNFPVIRIVPAGMPSNPTVYAQPGTPQNYSG